MVFSSLLFLFVFLPAFLAAYYLTPLRHRNATALLGSYFFYAWGEPVYILLLFFSSAVDYVLSRMMIDKIGRRAGHGGKLLLASVVMNLACLFYFKYASFFLDGLRTVLTVLHAPFVLSFAPTIALPLGISFFTFQKLSYMVDVYRGAARPAQKFLDYALYVALFPQLIAGPIVRYHDVAGQLVQRPHTWDKMFSGIGRFCLGLGKKVLVANVLAKVADGVFSMQPASMPMSFAWLGMFAYGFQIYFDFAGYSDMAIGLGRMMGFEFLENFDRPYVSRSFTEFWRRWHISLSGWMREYLYIPLGGNRLSEKRTYLNLWIVFLLSGLWHGANWTFLAWGAYHGFFLVLEKSGRMDWLKRMPVMVANAWTFLFVNVGWVFFRSDSLDFAGAYLGRLLGMACGDGHALGLRRIDVIGNRGMFVLLAAVLISLTPSMSGFRRKRHRIVPWPAFHAAARFGFAMLLFLLSLCSLANRNFNPFIYFRF